MHKSCPSPLSITPTCDDRTTTFASEDDFDDKDNSGRAITVNSNVTNDYNQTIVDSVHRRLDNNERLLIIMRGCPGTYKFCFIFLRYTNSNISDFIHM